MVSRNSILLLIIIVCLTCASLSCNERSVAVRGEIPNYPKAGSFAWVNSSVIYDTAIVKKPVSLIVFTAFPNEYCDSLLNKSLRDSTVMGIIDKWYNACIIDGHSDSLISVRDTLVPCRYAARYIFEVSAYPITLVLDRNGNVYDRLPGYIWPEAYAAVLYQDYLDLKDQ